MKRNEYVKVGNDVISIRKATVRERNICKHMFLSKTEFYADAGAVGICNLPTKEIHRNERAVCKALRGLVEE